MRLPVCSTSRHRWPQVTLSSTCAMAAEFTTPEG